MNKHHNFGRPSGAKQERRMKGWRVWARGMALVRQVDNEIASKRENLYRFDDRFQRV